MVGPLPPEEQAGTPELVEHGRFVRNLAWRLLHDEDAADEVVQETMLAAVKAQPERDRSLRPWLATVARNVIRRRFRTATRVRKREEAAAKPEALPSTVDMVARAEMLKEVVDAVLALEEPNRSTVLLRYYEDLPPREIAARLHVGVETVRGRLKRAVKQLRRRLDARHPQGRAGWAPVLAGLCGLDVPAELLAAGSGSATSTAAAAETAAPTFAGAVSVAAAFLVGAGLSGALLWQALAPSEPTTSALHSSTLSSALSGRAPAREASEQDAVNRPAVLRGRPPTPEEVAHQETRNEALRIQVAALEARVQTLLPPPRDPQVFRFALPEDAPAFDAAEWAKLAGHMLAMAKRMPEVKTAIVRGEPIPPHLVLELRRHNTPLAQLAVRLGPELEVQNPNQAYTHPAVVANLVRAALLLLDDPLSHEQEIAVRALGDAWAGDLERTKAALAEDAPALARLVAEAEAKMRFYAALKDLLSPSQYTLLFHPQTEGVVQLDLLAPGWDFMLRHFVSARDLDSLEREMLTFLFDLADVEVDDLKPYAWVGREWVASIPHASHARTMRDTSLAFPTVEAVLAMARAEVAAVERIVAMGGLDEEAASRLHRVAAVLVPHLRADAPAVRPEARGDDARADDAGADDAGGDDAGADDAGGDDAGD